LRGDTIEIASEPPPRGAADHTSETIAASRETRATVIARWSLWIAIPSACAVWVAVTSTNYYPVFDEWVMVDRATSVSWLRGLLLGFNGHMWSLASAMYNLQTHLFDYESNWLMPMLLVASLVALQLSLAGVLFRLGLPTSVALIAATVVTYFGRASETMVYQHLFGYNFALAFSFAAAFVVLGKRRDRRAAVTVAALLLAALVCDSALAIGGVLFVAPLLLLLWPRRTALLALAPPVVAHVGWYLLDSSEALVQGTCQNCRSVRFPASFGDSVEFATAILVRSAGGLVGGFATAGVIVLIAATACTAVGLATRRLSPPVVAALVGGVLATLSTVGLLAYSRTGFWPTVGQAIATLGGESNRYVQPAAIFLLVGFAPAIAATLRPAGRTAASALTAVAAAGLVVVFALNLSSWGPTRDFYENWGDQVRAQVQEAVTVISEGCAPGERLDPDAQPVDTSFQISVALLQDLLDRGALTPAFGRPATPEKRAQMCVTA
jgi:hypothetical protein